MVEFYDSLLINIAMLYCGVSFITLLTYGYDKFAAESRSWRVSESTLLLLGLLGGWPGAIVAQQGFRHKTCKLSFRRQFWATVVVNMGVLLWLLSPFGAPWLQKVL